MVIIISRVCLYSVLAHWNVLFSSLILSTLQALHERKERLSEIEQRTEEVAQEAANFASLATRLRQKYES